MIREAIIKLVNKESLSFKEAGEIFREIFENKATPSQIAAFLVALSLKGEKEDEISAAASVVREKARKVKVRRELIGIEDTSEPVMDTCGTGGSGVNKFNISTAVAFIVSAGGIKVAKHGNRAMSSNCGSADVLEAMGIKIDAAPSVMEESIKKVGIGFLFAPLYHPALGEVAKIRREIGVRTIFNILGPLCNPALASHQLLGVHSEELVPIMAKVLKRLGLKKAFVVYGKDLKDEISLTGQTKVAFLNNKIIEKFSLTPSDFGLRKISLKDLEVKNSAESAKVIKDIFEGKKGASRDVVLANAGACFYILGKAINLKEAVRSAANIIDRGLAKKKYQDFKDFLNERCYTHVGHKL